MGAIRDLAEGFWHTFANMTVLRAYNALINARQVGIAPAWPMDYDEPDVVYDDTLAFTAGDVRLELHHARGETDDHTWIWWPERLRAMSHLAPELLIPGHGVPIVGRDRVRQALDETAEWLETLEHETVARMNAGATLDTVLAEVRPPAHLAERPYLQAVYDEPDYVVRNVWRLYGGWWDGVASHLKPAREREIGREVARLAGGVERLVARARELAAAGDLALASHLVDWAAAAEPEGRGVHAARAAIYEARARDAGALMTRGIFSAAARESAGRAGEGA
ncbi:MAG TPA: alkyl sulfatase dimerization domain-containing protein [Methylomirabilota bacterium]